MSGLFSLHGQIKNARSKIFRRLYIKRRLLGSGLYEDEWQQVSVDVMKWGTIKKSIDETKVNSFKFANFSVVMSNLSGLYNPHDDENSMWYGYGDQQRTLVKIVAGLEYEYKTADGIWQRIEFPSNSLWDVGSWDASQWDSINNTFYGIIWGDINISDSGQISFPVCPQTECFRQYMATNLVGYDTSLTASEFITMLRDQQDVAGNYIFRPFFGDSVGGFEFASTTVEYVGLATATAENVVDSYVWDVIERLAASENMIPYPTKDGVFRFVGRSFDNTTPVFHFYGPGYASSQYGVTIKQIKYYGFRISKYYSRVDVQFADADTTTSHAIIDSDYRVRGDSSPWTLGEKTMSVDNNWIPNATVAEQIAQELFDEYSAAKKEIDFTTSFIPHLELMDRVQISYDAGQITANSLWDLYNWAENEDATPPTVDDLIFDDSKTNAIKLNAKEFIIISLSLNLDTGECTFTGRE